MNLITRNRTESDFEEIRKVFDNKVTTSTLLMMKAPVILVRQSEVDFVSVVEWYESKINQLITEEHTAEDKKVLKSITAKN